MQHICVFVVRLPHSSPSLHSTRLPSFHAHSHPYPNGVRNSLQHLNQLLVTIVSSIEFNTMCFVVGGHYMADVEACPGGIVKQLC